MPGRRPDLAAALEPARLCIRVPVLTTAREFHENVSHHHDNSRSIVPRLVRAVSAHLASHRRDIFCGHLAAKKRRISGFQQIAGESDCPLHQISQGQRVSTGVSEVAVRCKVLHRRNPAQGMVLEVSLLAPTPPGVGAPNRSSPRVQKCLPLGRDLGGKRQPVCASLPIQPTQRCRAQQGFRSPMDQSRTPSPHDPRSTWRSLHPGTSAPLAA